MFKFLRRRRQRSIQSERLLFEFFDGKGMRRVDPLVAQMALLNHDKFNATEHPAFVDDGQEPESTYMANAICDAFGVTEWNPDDETGMTRGELYSLYNEFNLYCAWLQKKIGIGSTSSPPTDSTTSSNSPEPPAETTNSSAACTSVESESKPSKPTAPSEEPATECVQN